VSAQLKASEQRPILIVKRTKKVVGGHHGGAWKVAYADFVTALMAFFLVMWLVATVSNEQRAALFDYFKNPSMEQGKSSKPAPGQAGPGGASTSVINLRGGLDAPRTISVTPPGLGSPMQIADDQSMGAAAAVTVEQIEAANELKRLESLMQDLKEAVNQSQALEPFKDQLLIDISPEGLRVQIVDAKNRPMFDLGSAELKEYTHTILVELATYLNSVPNRISIVGHTDTRPYVGRAGYSNWELSTERANAARRALEAGRLGMEKTMRVVGLSSLAPFDKADPDNPINRRISIVVMTKAAEEAALEKLTGVEVNLESETEISVDDQMAAAQPDASVPAAIAAIAPSTSPPP
jgi:chemotaxis protein MotB